MRRIIGILVALAAVAPAHAAEWQPAHELTPGRSVIDYRLTADGRGDVLTLALTSGGPGGDQVELFRRPPGGEFGTPTAFSGEARFDRQRVLAAGRFGHALALWTAQRGSPRSRPPCGRVARRGRTPGAAEPSTCSWR